MVNRYVRKGPDIIHSGQELSLQFSSHQMVLGKSDVHMQKSEGLTVYKN